MKEYLFLVLLFFTSLALIMLAVYGLLMSLPYFLIGLIWFLNFTTSHPVSFVIGLMIFLSCVAAWEAYKESNKKYF
jgi:4-hydroxybenzoate polyprenyltransferase